MSDFHPKECDIVMEGGVTSGVVYPSFVAGLASRFTLRSIGGTSVGAVAAIAAAAAQFSRNNQQNPQSFDQLDQIPAQLQEDVDGKSRLFSLFQPCADLKRHFEVLISALNRSSKFKAVSHISLALVTRFPLGALAGGAAWLLSFWVSRFPLQLGWSLKFLLTTTNWHGLLAFAWYGVSALACLWLGALVEFVITGWRGLRRNRCGICPGISADGASPPALIEWLHNLVQTIAGLPHNAPLTFGQLARSHPPIELALMTTGLSELRAHRLPPASNDLVFRASEFRQLFPAEIVQYLIDHSDPASHSDKTRALLSAADRDGDMDHYYLPRAEQLPIIVTARMSLSFPLLLQAVPLYRIRESQNGSNEAALLRIWFSDGGLTSNFPIHFFDSPLPTRPTFGITLTNDFDLAKPASERVHLPSNNRQGLNPAYLHLDDEHGMPAPARLATALIRTIRTWRDEALKRTPGYRDRVVQIHHTKQEGGLNLNMPKESIDRMRESGRLAASTIIDRFLCDDVEKNGWLNHRWVRMRSTAALLQDAIAPLQTALSAQQLRPSYQQMWAGEAPKAAYPLNDEERQAGRALWAGIAAVPTGEPANILSNTAPRPEPSLVIGPKQT